MGYLTCDIRYVARAHGNENRTIMRFKRMCESSRLLSDSFPPHHVPHHHHHQSHQSTPYPYHSSDHTMIPFDSISPSNLIRHLIRHVLPTQPNPLISTFTIPPPHTLTNPTHQQKQTKKTSPSSLLKQTRRLVRNLLVEPPLLGRVDLALAELLLRGVQAWAPMYMLAPSPQG